MSETKAPTWNRQQQRSPKTQDTRPDSSSALPVTNELNSQSCKPRTAWSWGLKGPGGILKDGLPLSTHTLRGKICEPAWLGQVKGIIKEINSLDKQIDLSMYLFPWIIQMYALLQSMYTVEKIRKKQQSKKTIVKITLIIRVRSCFLFILPEFSYTHVCVFL